MEFEGEQTAIRPGDSGSLVIAEKGTKPLGMLIAQGRSVRVVDKVKRSAYYAVPLQSIFEAAELSLV
jgi:hypothetical protein